MCACASCCPDGQENPIPSRELGRVLQREMAHLLEAVESLLSTLRRAELTRRQSVVLREWERFLPELRKGLTLLSPTRARAGRKRRKPATKARSK